jgi:hypothetical protein
MMEFNKAIQEQFLHTQFIYGAFDLDLINKKKTVVKNDARLSHTRGVGGKKVSFIYSV